MVSLRQLRYLESLAETLHFGHAAEACSVSQPALSQRGSNDTSAARTVAPMPLGSRGAARSGPGSAVAILPSTLVARSGGRSAVDDTRGGSDRSEPRSVEIG